MAKYYVLVDREPIAVDLITWAQHCERRLDAAEQDGHDPWRVARSTFADGTFVSTVFLGLDHNWAPDGPPLIFETMIFGAAWLDEAFQERYSTWDEALIGHHHAVNHVVMHTNLHPVHQELNGVIR